VGWFRKGAPTEPLAVTMAGVKMGDRFLAVGVRDPALIAALAIKTGLTGTACAVDADEDRVKPAAIAIEGHGALAEVTRAPFGMLPYGDASFDVAVIRDLLMTLGTGVRSRCVSEVLRVLRPGGRVIVIEPALRGGFGALLNRQTRDEGYPGPTKSLSDEGFAAVRVLAESDGVIYAEGIKKA
jgi:demethylmenaquinone methyltransferase / 2-methoxy-6-polyprenyl-1,4-benzoquinol methylase